MAVEVNGHCWSLSWNRSLGTKSPISVILLYKTPWSLSWGSNIIFFTLDKVRTIFFSTNPVFQNYNTGTLSSSPKFFKLRCLIRIFLQKQCYFGWFHSRPAHQSLWNLKYMQNTELFYHARLRSMKPPCVWSSSIQSSSPGHQGYILLQFSPGPGASSPSLPVLRF